jgi:hypothetical protein
VAGAQAVAWAQAVAGTGAGAQAVAGAGAGSGIGSGRSRGTGSGRGRGTGSGKAQAVAGYQPPASSAQFCAREPAAPQPSEMAELAASQNNSERAMGEHPLDVADQEAMRKVIKQFGDAIASQKASKGQDVDQLFFSTVAAQFLNYEIPHEEGNEQTRIYIYNYI